jgi:hypothetical protein
MALLTGFWLWRQFWGRFFKAAYPPQKSDILPPFRQDTTSFKDMCVFYILKMSKGCFVWAEPSLLRARSYLIIALNR